MRAKPFSAWSSARFGRSVAQAREGSLSALGQLLDHYRDYLLRVANDEIASGLAVKVAPSDLVQQTFLQAAQGFPKFQGTTEAELRGWLRQILINELRDARKHYQATQKRAAACETPLEQSGRLAVPAQAMECPDPSACSQLVSQETREALQKAIERLPEDYRQVIEYRTFHKLSFSEVGEKMERSAEAARGLWSRALQRLTLHLVNHDDHA